MSAGAYLDGLIRYLNGRIYTLDNRVSQDFRTALQRHTKTERRLKLVESRTKPKRQRLPRLPRSTP